MQVFDFIEILDLNHSKLAALRNKDFMILEKKLKNKARFTSKYTEIEVSNFIKDLRYYHSEITLLFTKEFFSLRKIITSPSGFYKGKPHLINQVKNPAKFTEFLSSHFSAELAFYTQRCLDNNNLHALYSLCVFWEFLPEKIKITITAYLIQNLEELDQSTQEYFQFHNSLSSASLDAYFFRCLNKVEHPKKEVLVKNIANKLASALLNQESDFFILNKLTSAISHYETNDEELINQLTFFKQRSEQKHASQAKSTSRSYSIDTSKKSKSSYFDERKKSNFGYDRASTWFYIGAILTILRAGYGLMKSSKDNPPPKLRIEQTLTKKEFDYELKIIQKEALEYQYSNKILKTQTEPFTESRMKFISKMKGFVYSRGIQTTVQNNSDKNVIFFFNSQLGGFKYRLIYPNSSITTQLHFDYFLIYRGKDQMYVYTQKPNGEYKIGIAFNEFDADDKKILSTIYKSPQPNKTRKNTIIIQSDSVEID